MEYLPIIITVAVLHFLAVISPGPDFIMTLRNSILYSRSAGIYTAVGLGLGILLHVAYSLIGIGFIISKSILLFSVIKFLGALYLIYIGYKSLTANTSDTSIDSGIKKNKVSKISALKIGFMTNASNPKATLFFLSLFTLVISPDTPLFVKILMGAEMSIATSLWFAFVALVVTHKMVYSRVAKIQKYAEKIVGALLIALGLKLAFSSAK